MAIALDDDNLFTPLSKRLLVYMYLIDICEPSFHRNGIYPLTAYAMPHPPSRPRAKTPEMKESVKSETPEQMDMETRLVTSMSCCIKKPEEEGENVQMTIMLRMDDKMNRQLQCEISKEDNSSVLAEELVHYGFINEVHMLLLLRSGITFLC